MFHWPCLPVLIAFVPAPQQQQPKEKSGKRQSKADYPVLLHITTAIAPSC